MIHRLLARQMKSLGLDIERMPTDLEDWKAFVTKISRTYADADQERYLHERSLEISSKEMQQQWQAIENERMKAVHAGKLAILGEMAAGIAHEINNPLAIIKLNAEIIQDCLESPTPEREAIIHASNTLIKTIDRISKIISGLRTFARVGDEDPFVSTPVRQIIDETTTLCGEMFKTNSIELRVHCDLGDTAVECRSTQISQVILNLLSNSKDAVETLKEKWVEINAVDKGSTVEISVTDSGTGISKEIQEKIMQPFYTTKEPGKGTGLGLSISKGIIDQHSGLFYLDVKSQRTRFVVSLPKLISKSDF